MKNKGLETRQRDLVKKLGQLPCQVKAMRAPTVTKINALSKDSSA